MTSGWRVTSTQPATPVLEEKRRPMSSSEPSPALGHDDGTDRRDVRSREAVPTRADRAAAEPRDLDADAAGEELDRRRGVVEEGERVRLLMAPDGDHGGEAPGIALDRHVVSGGYENGAAEVGAVRQLVQELRELALRRREAHVDDVEALPDRPAQAPYHKRAAALEAGAEHADAEEAGLGRDGSNDSGAGGPVAAEISFG